VIVLSLSELKHLTTEQKKIKKHLENNEGGFLYNSHSVVVGLLSCCVNSTRETKPTNNTNRVRRMASIDARGAPSSTSRKKQKTKYRKLGNFKVLTLQIPCMQFF